MIKSQIRNGFTLVELVISISIFMIFIAIAGASYISLASANKQANDMQKLYREVRFVFDTFAQEIQNGKLDYSYFDEKAFDEIALSILSDQQTKRSIFKFDKKTRKLMVKKQERSEAGMTWSEAQWENLISEKFPLEDLSFSIFPLKNPYSKENAAFDEIQWQPSVTINLSADKFVFRTTYSLKTYGD